MEVHQPVRSNRSGLQTGIQGIEPFSASRCALFASGKFSFGDNLGYSAGRKKSNDVRWAGLGWRSYGESAKVLFTSYSTLPDRAVNREKPTTWIFGAINWQCLDFGRNRFSPRAVQLTGGHPLPGLRPARKLRKSQSKGGVKTAATFHDGKAIRAGRALFPFGLRSGNPSGSTSRYRRFPNFGEVPSWELLPRPSSGRFHEIGRAHV